MGHFSTSRLDAIVSSGSIGNASIIDLLDIVEYVPIRDSEDAEDIYRLRYDCYLREGAITRNDSGMLTDDFDNQHASRVFGLRIEGVFVASVRISLLDRHSPQSPSMLSFRDHLEPLIASGLRLLDVSRFVVNHHASKRHPSLLFATLRLPFLAAHHLDVDTALAAVRSEHMAFYSRKLEYRPAADPRPYLKLTKPLALMTADYALNRERVLSRYPTFIARKSEEAFLFHRWPLQPGEPLDMREKSGFAVG